MSIKLMSRAWEMDIPTSQKMILLALADRANDEGECWPGQEELARKGNMSPRSVVNHIDWLEDHGLLKVERRQKGNTRQSNRYTVTLDSFVREGGVTKLECANPAHATVAHANPAYADSAPPNVQSATSESANPAHSFNVEPSMNHQMEPSLVSATASAMPAKRKKSESNPLNVATWNAYAAAYHDRYGVGPVRNATVNGQIANFVKRLGENAPHVAAHYVNGNSAFYLTKGHSVGQMLVDAEKLHTEWATGRRVTQSAARQADRSQSNLDNSRSALDLLNAKYGDRA